MVVTNLILIILSIIVYVFLISVVNLKINILLFISIIMAILIIVNIISYIIKKVFNRDKNSDFLLRKPILYLYPNEDMNINVKLEHSNRIITSYPKYTNGWSVKASSDGSLYDNSDKYYYALYWDEKNPNKISFDEGFYVTKENAIDFLEEKLSTVGLNDKERNEFIMYWLPKLEENEKSLVYFELTEERQYNNKLIITPEPDHLFRINIHIKKVNRKIEIKEQKLEKFERIGFVAVEWGGTIHN